MIRHKTMGPAIRKRRKLCLEIAENILKRVRSKYGRAAADTLDVDDIRLEIGCHLPLMYDEAQEEWDAMTTAEEKRAKEKPKKPSVIARLRAALGKSGEHLDLMQTIEAAIERLEQQRSVV